MVLRYAHAASRAFTHIYRFFLPRLMVIHITAYCLYQLFYSVTRDVICYSVYIDGDRHKQKIPYSGMKLAQKESIGGVSRFISWAKISIF